MGRRSLPQPRHRRSADRLQLDADRKTYILVRGRLIPMPDGLMFMVPTKILPTGFSPLFSWATKLRMAQELLHPPRAAQADESVASLVERHYGAEMVDRLADPLLSGVYGGEAVSLSVRASSYLASPKWSALTAVSAAPCWRPEKKCPSPARTKPPRHSSLHSRTVCSNSSKTLVPRLHDVFPGRPTLPRSRFSSKPEAGPCQQD